MKVGKLYANGIENTIKRNSKITIIKEENGSVLLIFRRLLTYEEAEKHKNSEYQYVIGRILVTKLRVCGEVVLKLAAMLVQFDNYINNGHKLDENGKLSFNIISKQDDTNVTN